MTLFLLSALAGCDEKSSDGSDSGPGAGPGSAQVDVGFIELQPVSVAQPRALPGRVVAFQLAEIRPQVSGIIEERLFDAGAYVAKGQQLYQIEAARYEADLQTARANLEEARAEKTNALSLVERYKTLLPDELIGQQQYDDASARLQQAEAAVSQAQAGVDRAKINLDYTRVRAPIKGYISPSNVTQGGLVSAQQASALATIRQLDPVYVDVTQPAAEVLPLRDSLQNSEDSDENVALNIRLTIPDSAQPYPHEGTLNAIDPVADADTGAIRLRLLFPNPDNRLVPGMFVRVTLESADPDKKITVPREAVNFDEDGSKSVWVVGKNEKAQKRPITTGDAFGSDWVVLEGLKPGDRVIVEGTMGLREGAGLSPTPLDTQNERPEDR